MVHMRIANNYETQTDHSDTCARVANLEGMWRVNLNMSLAILGVLSHHLTCEMKSPHLVDLAEF